MEKEIGLIGYPLSHSFSPKWFQDYFKKNNITNAKYNLFPLENIEDFPELIKKYPNLIGLNVTIPHKQSVIQYLDRLSEEAKAVGAVNCISLRADENLHKREIIGYNTDVIGFYESLKPLLKQSHQKALIFGNGGASQAVKYVLKKLNIEFLTISRKSNKDYLQYSELTAEILSSHTVWINTTPLGMLPNIDTFLDIDYSQVSSNHIAYDLVYNPTETLFLKKCKEQGAITKNGLEMLHIQAEKSADIFGV